MTPRRSLLVSKLAHIAPDLGLAMDFRATLCPRHPDIFTFANTSHGHALQLVDPPPPPPSPLPPPLRPAVQPDRLIDRPREVLAMTVEKRTLVDHLTHFRRDFGLPNRLRALLVRHPELFYVSIKGVRHSAFLVEAFDDDGRLLVEDGMLVGKDRLEELVREGKKIRRARKKGVFPVDGDSDEDDEEEDNVAEGLSEVDGEFGDLFEEDSVAGEGWNEVGDEGGIEGDGDEEDDPEVDAMEEFWVKKAAAEGLVDSGTEHDVW
ncbi:unnamed protein product [Triticum turgidum subsp. durum]|uniref:PORR domain-containing protein n=1 Tax=Triticum turgidum subsp. durum TaxID=4567 RepID=A0A9R0WZ49_TRITD|nr:unnamed protein product [Triticum turgidum subsp. durum]